MEKLKEIIEATINNNIEVDDFKAYYIPEIADMITKETASIVIDFHCKLSGIDHHDKAYIKVLEAYSLFIEERYKGV